MKKLLCLICVLLTLGCEPKGPYKPQNWWNDEDTTILSEYDQSIIDMLDTATTIDEIFPSEWYGDPGCYDPEYDNN